MMDIPAGWTPGEFKPSIDPMLETTIDDIKNDDKTRKEYIDLIVEKLKTVYEVTSFKSRTFVRLSGPPPCLLRGGVRREWRHPVSPECSLAA